MATTLLNKKKIFSGPSIYVDLSYEHSRSNADMIYKIYYKVYMADYPGSDYYNNRLQIKVYLNGSLVHTDTSGNTGKTQIKLNSNTGNKTVSNKTSGTTQLYITVKDTQNSSWVNYTSDTFNLTVDPAYPVFNSCTIDSVDETSLRVNWAADCTIDKIYYKVGSGSWVQVTASANANSGNFLVSGLTAGTRYNINTSIYRKGTTLSSESGNKSQYTYEYPKVTDANNFTIGGVISGYPNTADALWSLYNPLRRTVTVNMKQIGNPNTVLAYYYGNWNGQVGLVGPSDWTQEVIDAMYNSIPNNEYGEYYLEVVYGNINTSVYNPSTKPRYSVPHTDDERPTFALSNITNIVNSDHTDIVLTNDIGIQNNNTYSLTISTHMVTKFGANPTKYIVVDASGINKEENYVDNNPMTITGIKVDTSINVIAVDSRNNQTTIVITPDILPYIKPYSDNQALRRVNSITDKVKVTLAGFISLFNTSKIKTGKQNYLKSIKYKYKLSTNPDSSYSEYATIGDYSQDITYVNNSFVLEDFALPNSLSVDTDKTYTFKFVIEDEIHESDSEITLQLGPATGYIWKDLQNKRVGINKKPTEALDVHGNIKGDGNVEGINIKGNALYVDGVKMFWYTDS